MGVKTWKKHRFLAAKEIPSVKTEVFRDSAIAEFFAEYILEHGKQHFQRNRGIFSKLATDNLNH